MKVLVVGTSTVGSGVTSATQAVVQAAREAGHVVVVHPVDDRPRRRPNRVNLENVSAVLRDGFEVHRQAARSSADVVWLHTLGAPILPAVRCLVVVLGVVAARRPLIVHLHAFELGRSVVRSRAERAVLRLVGTLARRLVVLHERDAEVLARLAPGRVEVLPNFVEVPEAPPDREPDEALRLVYVGALIRRKGLPELLRAMELVTDLDVRLTVVGGAGDDGDVVADQIESSVAELTERGRVRFAGRVPPDAVRSHLRAHDVFVLPSRAEGTPMALIEAMAAGCAVVVSSAGDMPAVVDGAGLVVDVEPDAIAGAIRTLAADRTLVARMAATAHGRALARHSLEHGADRIGEILAVVGSPASPSQALDGRRRSARRWVPTVGRRKAANGR